MKGYIVKLYQKIYNIDGTERNLDEFNVWLSFDYMRIIPVERFESFYKKSISINSDQINNRDLNSTRQKLYLCGDDEKDIFSQDNIKPILSITMIKFQNLSKRKDQNECLAKFFENKGIEYELFDSLSHSDKILVIRENSYEKIIDMLIELKSIKSEKIGGISKLYTISCLDYTKSNSLCEDDNIIVRVSIPLNYVGYINVNESDNIRIMVGKEDIELEWSSSSKGMMELLINDGIISKDGACNVIKRISLLKKIEISAIQRIASFLTDDSCAKSEVTLLKNVIKKIGEKNYSSSLKNLLNRLVIRAWQIEKGNAEIIDNNGIWDKVETFIRIAEKYAGNIIHNDSVVEGIKSLSLLMDNMTSDNYDDFEIPQGNSRFTGTMSRLLQSYNIFLAELSELTKKLKKSTSTDSTMINYSMWAVIDTNEVVSVKQLFIDRESTDRLLIINLSHEAMFHITEIIAWSIHEIGHYLRIGWNRKCRNKTFRENAQRIFLKIYEQYLNNELAEKQLQDLNSYQKKHTICNIDVCTERIHCKQSNCHNKHFDDQIDLLKIYYDGILRALFDGDILNNCGVNRSQYVNMRESIEEGLDILEVAYREAQADMYMVSVLSIENAKTYIEILKRYFEYSQMDMVELNPDVVIRIEAVIIVIESINKDCHVKEYKIDNLKLVLKNISQSEPDNPFVNTLKKNIKWAFASKLAEFLYQVKENIDEALKLDECRKIKEKICKSYYAMEKGDSFENALDFIEKYSGEKI